MAYPFPQNRPPQGMFPEQDFDATGGIWGQDVTTGPTAEQEAGAYGTAFGGLAADSNFGRVSPEAVSGYYDLAGKRAFGEGNERINQILAERGFGPSRVGQGAEMAGRLSRDIELNRAGAELGMAQQGASQQAALRQMMGQSRYGALTRGGTTTRTQQQYTANPYKHLGSRPSGLAPRSGMQNWSQGNWGTSSVGPQGQLRGGAPTQESAAPYAPPSYNYPSAPVDQPNPYISLSDRVRSGAAYNPPPAYRGGYD